jgi:hypothetical protein
MGRVLKIAPLVSYDTGIIARHDESAYVFNTGDEAARRAKLI